MAKDDESFELDEGGHSEYVPVVFAKSVEEAEKYRELLDDHDIPAICGEDEEAGRKRKGLRSGISRGMPVLVPEALLDEASEIIADREDADEFETVEGELEDQTEEDEEEIELADGFEIEEEEAALEEEEEEEDEFLKEDEDEEEDEEEEEEGLEEGQDKP